MSVTAMARQPVDPCGSSRIQKIRNQLDVDIDYEEIDDNDSVGSFPGDGVDDIAEYWDPYLYQLQQQAPKPNRITCTRHIPDKPEYYGDEYHGAISRDEVARLLGYTEGNYLVRKGLSQSGTYSLSFLYGGGIRHYHLHYDNGEHSVGETSFDSIEDLVADGLITLFMEDNNVEEYLKNAQDKRASTVVVPAGDPSGGNGLELEGTPPPLPPRNKPTTSSGQLGLSAIIEDNNTPQNYINTVLRNDSKDGSLRNYHYEKPHNFKIHTFYNMPWCNLCHNFVFGLRLQGYKCKDCGYVAHKQCKECVPKDCTPSKQLVKRVYGVDLTTLVKMCSTKIPIVVKECIEEIERRGLDIDGLYRVPGKKVEILEIKKQYDSDMHVDLAAYEDCHAIAGALKLYFRELPIPIIPFDIYELVLIAARCSTEEETLETVHVLLKRIPPAYFNTLKALAKHLHKVQLNSRINRMDSKNLAVVFAPSVMRPPANADQLSAMTKLQEQKKITQLLISHYDVLFT